MISGLAPVIVIILHTGFLHHPWRQQTASSGCAQSGQSQPAQPSGSALRFGRVLLYFVEMMNVSAFRQSQLHIMRSYTTVWKDDMVDFPY